MRILLLNDSFEKGGKERRITELLKFFKHNSLFEFELIIFDDKIEYKEIYNYVTKVHIVPGRSVTKTPGMILKVLSICFKFKPNIIHCWGDLSLLLFSVVKIFYKTKFINSVIADAPSSLAIDNVAGVRKIYKRVLYSYSFSDVVTANSKAGLVSYNAPSHKSQYIYNGFNFNRINKLSNQSSIRNHIHIAETDLVIGMVAAFESRKDYYTVIAVASRILSTNKNCHFVLIGDGELRANIEKSVHSEVKDRVHFLGKINNVEEYVNIFDIGILSTNPKAHGEGISNAILEYMALKKPVVATSGGGTNEIVIDGWNGFLVEPQNIEDFEDKLLQLIKSNTLRLKYGQNGFTFVNENFSINKMCNSFAQLYENVNDIK